MADDPLDTETNVSVAVEKSGLKAAIRSRTIAAMDRLFGNLIDKFNPGLERRAKIQRAETEAEKRLIEAATEVAIERMKVDPEFAQRALNNHLGRIISEQSNKDAVARQALEQLRQTPPEEADMAEGPEQLDESFMNRLEFYSASASTDELRERWGRVLASEVRKPGTFSPKTLRLVDELSAKVALQFEQLCRNRIGNSVPFLLIEHEKAGDTMSLFNSGLVSPNGDLDRGIGFIKKPIKDQEYWIGDLGGGRGLGVSADLKVDSKLLGGGVDISMVGGKLHMPVLKLTHEGGAVASILGQDDQGAVDRLSQIISQRYGASFVVGLNWTEPTRGAEDNESRG